MASVILMKTFDRIATIRTFFTFETCHRPLCANADASGVALARFRQGPSAGRPHRVSSCADLARACGFLARHGQRASGERLLTRSQAKQVNAVMLTCGTYDAAGEFAYRVGLPGKSGVGGGIIAVVPGRCTLCVWSPGLDERGNSVAGVAALDRFTTLTGVSVF